MCVSAFTCVQIYLHYTLERRPWYDQNDINKAIDTNMLLETSQKANLFYVLAKHLRQRIVPFVLRSLINRKCGLLAFLLLSPALSSISKDLGERSSKASRSKSLITLALPSPVSGTTSIFSPSSLRSDAAISAIVSGLPRRAAAVGALNLPVDGNENTNIRSRRPYPWQ